MYTDMTVKEFALGMYSRFDSVPMLYNVKAKKDIYLQLEKSEKYKKDARSLDYMFRNESKYGYFVVENGDILVNETLHKVVNDIKENEIFEDVIAHKGTPQAQEIFDSHIDKITQYSFMTGGDSFTVPSDRFTVMYLYEEELGTREPEEIAQRMIKINKSKADPYKCGVFKVSQVENMLFSDVFDIKKIKIKISNNFKLKKGANFDGYPFKGAKYVFSKPNDDIIMDSNLRFIFKHKGKAIRKEILYRHPKSLTFRQFINDLKNIYEGHFDIGSEFPFEYERNLDTEYFDEIAGLGGLEPLYTFFHYGRHNEDRIDLGVSLEEDIDRDEETVFRNLPKIPDFNKLKYIVSDKDQKKTAKPKKTAKAGPSKTKGKYSALDIERVNSGRSTSKNSYYTLDELKGFLKERGLDEKGTKKALVVRLKNFEESS
jgi:hypothetical protein